MRKELPERPELAVTALWETGTPGSRAMLPLGVDEATALVITDTQQAEPRPPTYAKLSATEPTPQENRQNRSIPPTKILAITAGLPTNRPEPTVYICFQNSICVGIVDELAQNLGRRME